MTHNQFYLAYKRQPGAVPFDLENETGDSFPGAVYVSRMLSHADEILGPRGLTFVLTSDVRSLPVSGPNVVVILREDEWCRVPPYAFEVRAVFKTHGETYRWDRNPVLEHSFDALVSSAQDLRTEILRIPTRFRQMRQALRTITRFGTTYKLYDYPLGYFRQLDLPLVPFAQRKFDAYFGGSLISQRVAKYPWLAGLETPKIRSRRTMVQALAAIKKAYPQMAIEMELTASFWKTGQTEAERYSMMMMESRVCIVPRGSQLETFRYFEAMRAGCIVICESLPERMYYANAPHIRIHSWVSLQETLTRLLNDPDEMAWRHAASLEWWRDHCSERVMGAYVANSLINTI